MRIINYKEQRDHAFRYSHLNWFKRRLYYNFSHYKKIRKYIGGYWEHWIIEICSDSVWMLVNKEQAYDETYRPIGGRGTPIYEYYPIEFFDSKLKFTEEIKLQSKRQLKLERLIK